MPTPASSRVCSTRFGSQLPVGRLCGDEFSARNLSVRQSLAPPTNQRVYSLLWIVTVAVLGEPIVYPALGDNVRMTVSSGSGMVSSIGFTAMLTLVRPARMLTGLLSRR